MPTRTATEAQQEIDANEPRRLTNNNQTTQGARIHANWPSQAGDWSKRAVRALQSRQKTG